MITVWFASGAFHLALGWLLLKRPDIATAALGNVWGWIKSFASWVKSKVVG